MTNILITGAGGYIGSILVPHLLALGYDVTALDQFYFGRDRLPAHDKLTIVQQDTRDITPEQLEQVDAIVDMAAISNDPSGELFQDTTWAVNYKGRARLAQMARDKGISRYLLMSSCSVYGFQDMGEAVDETGALNPLTTYARANVAAERDITALQDAGDFTPVILRLATVFGLSPRMRFDLAINGMTYGAWANRELPLMRDGTQWRPMIHVKDVARVIAHMLTAPARAVHKQIFNIGDEKNLYQIGPLGKRVAAAVGDDVTTRWYGDPDHRSYIVDFGKIATLGFHAGYVAEDGVAEIVEALETGKVDKTTDTITLEWYKQNAFFAA